MKDFYEQLEDNLIKCLLCPNYCRLKDNQVGLCLNRKNIGGKMISLSYGKVSSIALDPIEKKPFRFYYGGSQILSVGGYGCNLKCTFCQNYAIAQMEPEMINLSSEDLVTKALKIDNNIGVAFTYNEPLINYEYVIEVSKLLKKFGKKTVLVTNGYLNPEPFLEVLKYVDAMNIDLKSFENSFYNGICKGNVEVVKNNIIEACKKIHVEISFLVIDGLNSDISIIEEMAKWLSSIDKNIPLHINRYFPCYKMKNPPTEIQTLKALKKVADQYLNRVIIGNVPIHLLWD